MKREELESVLDHHRLPRGDVWTLPILLQGKSQEFAAFQPGQMVRLIDPRDGRPAAILQIEDKFELDRDSVANRWFGTTDKNHPGVRRFIERGLTVLGGPIEYLGPSTSLRSPYELTPAQTRTIFDTKGWTKVVAFHAISAPTTADEQIISQACEWCRADGVLVHPVAGTSDDRASSTLLTAYEQLLQRSLPNGLLATFNSYPRHAGPREAVFNALCRKNFGCTHFVIGAQDEYDALFYPASTMATCLGRSVTLA